MPQMITFEDAENRTCHVDKNKICVVEESRVSDVYIIIVGSYSIIVETIVGQRILAEWTGIPTETLEPIPALPEPEPAPPVKPGFAPITFRKPEWGEG